MNKKFDIFTDLIDIEDIDTSGFFTPNEWDELSQEFESIVSIYQDLIPLFVQTYRDDTNRYDDYLNPKKRAKLANKYQKSEEELEEECLIFFQIELPNIKRAINKASSIQKWDSIIDICDSLITFYNVRTYWEDLESTLEIALEASKKYKSKVSEARIYNSFAHTLRLLGRAQDGVDYGLKSYDIFCELEDVQGESESCYTLGYLYRSLGEWDESIKFFTHCLSLFQSLKDSVGEAGALDGLGQVYTKTQRFSQAQDILLESLQLKEDKIRDQFEISKTLNNLGKVYKLIGKLDEARSLFEKSLSIKEQLGDKQGRGVSYNELGIVCRLMKNIPQALEYFDKSLEMKKSISSSERASNSDSHGEGLTLLERGILYSEIGEYQNAIIDWQNALEKLNDYSPEISIARDRLDSLQGNM